MVGIGAQAQIEKAIAQIQVKADGEKDYTQHVLDDGNIISTQERVIKDVRFCSFILVVEPVPDTPRNLRPGTSSSDADSD